MTLTPYTSDVPVGTVAVYKRDFIGVFFNSGASHSEVLAMQHLAQVFSPHEMSKVSLFVGLEPCPSCMFQAISLGLRYVFFGAWNPNYGACGGRFSLAHTLGVQTPKTYGGFLESQFQPHIKNFFKQIRAERDSNPR